MLEEAEMSEEQILFQDKIFDEISKLMDRHETVLQVGAGLCSGKVPKIYQSLTLKECQELYDFYDKCESFIYSEQMKEYKKVMKNCWFSRTEFHPKLTKLISEYYERYCGRR